MGAGAGCDMESGTGVKDVSFDPIYAPPEKRMSPNAPGKVCHPHRLNTAAFIPDPFLGGSRPK